jgi:hypothetical protein
VPKPTPASTMMMNDSPCVFMLYEPHHGFYFDFVVHNTTQELPGKWNEIKDGGGNQHMPCSQVDPSFRTPCVCLHTISVEFLINVCLPSCLPPDTRRERSPGISLRRVKRPHRHVLSSVWDHLFPLTNRLSLSLKRA